jgi:putative phage-type endonuclease
MNININMNEVDNDEISFIEYLPESLSLVLEEATYNHLNNVFENNCSIIMNDKYLEQITEEVANTMFDVFLCDISNFDWDISIDEDLIIELDVDPEIRIRIPNDTIVNYDNIYDFVYDRVVVFFTTIVEIPRSYPRGFENISNTRILSELSDILYRLSHVNQPPQRTPEWYAFRHELLTASEIGKVLGSDSEVNGIIYNKCKKMTNIDCASENFPMHLGQNSPMHWGQKYEPVTIQLYQQLYDVWVQEFGCIQHPEYKCIGASPDGIVCGPLNSTRYGRMIEIKNIVNREITGIPLTKYWIQMQIQMEVCDLDLCDFVETRFKEYEKWQDIFLDVYDPTRKRGIILQFMKRGDGLWQPPHYVYMPLSIQIRPDKIQLWIDEKCSELNETCVLNQIAGWYLDEYSCVIVPRNRKWFEAVRPKLIETWDTIVREREEGYSHREPKKKMPKLNIDLSLL